MRHTLHVSVRLPALFQAPAAPQFRGRPHVGRRGDQGLPPGAHVWEEGEIRDAGNRNHAISREWRSHCKKYVKPLLIFFWNAPSHFGPILLPAQKKFVSEWVKYRFGVFDERGYRGSAVHPLFHRRKVGSDSVAVTPTSCLATPLAEREFDVGCLGPAPPANGSCAITDEVAQVSSSLAYGADDLQTFPQVIFVLKEPMRMTKNRPIFAQTLADVQLLQRLESRSRLSDASESLV